MSKGFVALLLVAACGLARAATSDSNELSVSCWKFCGLQAMATGKTMDLEFERECCSRVAAANAKLKLTPSLLQAEQTASMTSQGEGAPAQGTPLTQSKNVMVINGQKKLKLFGKNKNSRLLIAIATAPNNMAKRRSIRDTWMKFVTTSNSLLTDSERANIDILFFIGKVQGDDSDRVESELAAEQTLYNDIVRSETYHEHYFNLTRKSKAMIKYADSHHYDAMFKTDDDAFVRVDYLMQMAHSNQHLSSAFVGRCSYNFPLTTDSQSKNFMGDTYPHDTVPLLCHGGGYLLGSSLLNFIATNSETLPSHRNEDASVSLWLTTNPLAPTVYVNSKMPTTFYSSSCNPSSIYLTPLRVEELYTLWGNVNQVKDTCANNFRLSMVEMISNSGGQH